MKAVIYTQRVEIKGHVAVRHDVYGIINKKM